jgi:hypothetical protein
LLAAGSRTGENQAGAADRGEKLHPGDQILDKVDARLRRRFRAYGPYFFPDLHGTRDSDERAASDEVGSNRLASAISAARRAGEAQSNGLDQGPSDK